jgi:hypothetical protein
MRSFGSAVGAYHFSVLVLGLGAALIDLARSGTESYYVGFIVLFIGMVAVAGTIGRYVLRPTWLFLLCLPVEGFGWWNVFWGWLYLNSHGSIPAQIALARFQDPVGVIIVPQWFFILSSALAIAIPIGATLGVGNRWAFDPESGRRMR